VVVLEVELAVFVVLLLDDDDDDDGNEITPFLT